MPAADGLARVSPSVREGWVDSAKGIGIVLVVIGHALGGMIDAGLFSRTGVAQWVFYAIYTFHMPMFFFLSGFFVERRLRADRHGFLRSVLVRMLWPYLLWIAVQGTAIQWAGGLVNRPLELGLLDYVALLWQPAAQFWFLYVLALLSVISFLVVPRMGANALLLLAMFAYALPKLATLPFSVHMTCTFGIAYAAGVLLGQARESGRATVSSSVGVIIAAASAAVWMACVVALHDRGMSYWSVEALPAAVAGSVAWIGIAATPWLAGNRLLHLLGQRSMAIYLLHVLFVAGTRIVLNKFVGASQPALILTAAVAAGMVGPLLVQWLARRARMAGWLGLA